MLLTWTTTKSQHATKRPQQDHIKDQNRCKSQLLQYQNLSSSARQTQVTSPRRLTVEPPVVDVANQHGRQCHPSHRSSNDQGMFARFPSSSFLLLVKNAQDPAAMNAKAIQKHNHWLWNPPVIAEESSCVRGDTLWQANLTVENQPAYQYIVSKWLGTQINCIQNSMIVKELN